MSTEGEMLPVTFEPIPKLDPEKPLEALLSLPAWLQRCVKGLTADYMRPTIPAELALSEEQRVAIAVRVEALKSAEMSCDIDRTMAVVVTLLDAFPGAKLGDDQARTKAQGYMTALESIPTWA